MLWISNYGAFLGCGKCSVYWFSRIPWMRFLRSLRSPNVSAIETSDWYFLVNRHFLGYTIVNLHALPGLNFLVCPDFFMISVYFCERSIRWSWEHNQHFTKSVSRKSKLALRNMRKHPQYTHMISKLWMSDWHFLPKTVFTLQKLAFFYTCDFLGNRYQISDPIAHFLEWENCPPFRFYLEN